MSKGIFDTISWVIGIAIYLTIFHFGRTKINARERRKRLRR